MTKLSPDAHRKLTELDEFMTHVHRLHGFVEQFAIQARTGGEDRLSAPMKRGFEKLKFLCLSAGHDAMADLAAGMQIAAGRGGATQSKLRILREGVASLRSQIELEQRSILAGAGAAADDDDEQPEPSG